MRSSRLLTRKNGTREAKNAVQVYFPVSAKAAPMTISVPKPNPGAIRHRSQLWVRKVV